LTPAAITLHKTLIRLAKGALKAWEHYVAETEKKAYNDGNLSIPGTPKRLASQTPRLPRASRKKQTSGVAAWQDGNSP
jgi:hypothetical protein